MTKLTAAAYAAILDPDRKVLGWWKRAPIKCGNGSTDGVQDTFIGPDDLHTARSESWRGEIWLSARSYGWLRNYGVTQVFKANGKPENDTLIEENTDHAAAISEAVRRVNDAAMNRYESEEEYGD